MVGRRCAGGERDVSTRQLRIAKGGFVYEVAWPLLVPLIGLAGVLRQRGVQVVCANLDKEIRQVRLAALLAAGVAGGKIRQLPLGAAIDAARDGGM